MKQRLAAFVGTVRRFVVPEVKTARSPAWHLKWPWGMVQCWKLDRRRWGVKIGRFAWGIRNDWPWRTALVHIHCGHLEAWSDRKCGPFRRHND